MKNDERLNRFISQSIYTEPVAIKKLRFIYSTILKYVELNEKRFEDLSILEVGCGNGGIVFPLATLGCKVRSFDINEKAVNKMQKRIDQKNIQNITVTVNDGFTYDDGKIYDIVLASEVFQCLLEANKFAKNLQKKLAKGSYLIVTIPNGFGPYELCTRLNPIFYMKRWNWLRQFLGKRLTTPGMGGRENITFFTRKKLLKMLSEFSLKLIHSGKSDAFFSISACLRNSPFYGNIDIKLADRLPYWMVSGWYFVFEKEET